MLLYEMKVLYGFALMLIVNLEDRRKAGAIRVSADFMDENGILFRSAKSGAKK